MTCHILRGAAALALALTACAASAQGKPLDIGFIGTLSTPAGYIGEDERDAFMRAAETRLASIVARTFVSSGVRYVGLVIWLARNC